VIKNEYFENMKEHYNDYTIAKIVASRSYEVANKYNLDYPTIVEATANEKNFARALKDAEVKEFVFAEASTNAVDLIAEFLKAGYSITGVVDMADYLGEAATWLTWCQNGLRFEKI
jgi:hypothetical protein